ncbi:MAG: CDF family Co(II)/Ni(II) efflux transporter DmeF [Beijerinckiaceae bacterium]|nr:CDF family Co(II)/Ni(II) efflux transporter DmeF [Beijerinckiaceae bacterium]
MSGVNGATRLSHDHNFLGDHHDDNARRTRAVVALTFVMMIGEIVAGLAFNSMALLADGIHMATHAGALAVAAAAYAFARRNVDNPRFSFGTGKVGDLAGFASALFLMFVAFAIAAESISRLYDPRPVAFLEAGVVAVIGLLVNIVSAFMLGGGHGDDEHHGHDHGHAHGHDHVQHDARHHDNNMRSAIAHVLTDALTSVLAIVALLSGAYLGWLWLDPVMGVVGAIVITIWAIGLLRDTAGVLLDVTDSKLESEVRKTVEASGARILDLHLWRIGPGAHAAIVSVADGVLPEVVRTQLAGVRELVHVTVEVR